MPKKDLEKVAYALTSFPDDFNLNSKIKRQIEAKAKILKLAAGIDWAMAEQLAFGSLMLDGTQHASQGKTVNAERLVIAMQLGTIQRIVPVMSRFLRWRTGKENSVSIILFFRKLQCLPLIMDTLWIIQVCLPFGRLNLAILPMEPK